MIVAICAGGPLSEVAFSLKPDIWIGVDRGALYLVDEAIVPNAIVGDFDSVSAEEFARISKAVQYIEQFQAEKDETDTDLALEKALGYAPTEIWLTGVTGGRLDHYEAVLRSVYHLQQQHPNIVFKIVNPYNEIQFLMPGQHVLRKGNYSYVSFFAYGQTLVNVTLRGVKYETTDEVIEQGTTRFTSNEILSEGSISFLGGICLMIKSRD
ncbi:thiamine diphosphokinase [Solibacillus sp. MA9]|uniref:Thiamine diphosphokinase n=1 Tax=Solibacillus palustris TaxID=2908203 RepID=A0ABS9UA23_9BACL|nr:thiamine diphosphokinase [Solibacillus sp. MA9]